MRIPLSPLAPLALCALLGALPAAAAPATASAPHHATSQLTDGHTLPADESRRARVRSNRPGTIHAAYLAAERFTHAQERRDLEAFERTQFPPGQVAAQTILTEPPEPWMRALQLPDFPVRWNAKTVEYLRFFRDDPKGRAMIRAWFRRKHRYAALVTPILDEVGVPRDVIYVALAESGFDPRARSRVGAAGMWQFMEASGRVYGLMNDYWEDDRYDVERETWAAASYLKDLRARFGSWELALAAYNAGYGLVMTSMRRYNTNNFWALCEIESGLPYATTNYVPKIAAAAIVGANLEAFGLSDTLEGQLDPARFITRRVDAGTRLSDLAKHLEVSPTLLTELNARFVRGRLPPDGPARLVRIPMAAADKLDDAAGDIRADVQPYTVHTVLEGELLSEIAARHQLTEAELRRLNAVEDAAEIRAGVPLVVPRVAPPPLGAPPSSDAPLPIVAVPSVQVPGDKRLVLVRTTRAMTPRSLSEATGVAWQEIVAWNDLDPEARLLSGLWLQIVVARTFDAAAAGVRAYERAEVQLVLRGSHEHLDAELAQRDMVRRVYVAKKGDSLKRVAKRFELSVGSLGRINGFSRAHRLKTGERVLVYVPTRKTRGTKAAPAPKPTALTREFSVLAQMPPPATETRSSEAPSLRPPTTPETASVPGQRPAREGTSREVELQRPGAAPSPP